MYVYIEVPFNALDVHKIVRVILICFLNSITSIVTIQMSANTSSDFHIK